MNATARSLLICTFAFVVSLLSFSSFSSSTVQSGYLSPPIFGLQPGQCPPASGTELLLQIRRQLLPLRETGVTKELLDRAEFLRQGRHNTTSDHFSAATWKDIVWEVLVQQCLGKGACCCFAEKSKVRKWRVLINKNSLYVRTTFESEAANIANGNPSRQLRLLVNLLCRYVPARSHVHSG
jgi:hypothetical protein